MSSDYQIGHEGEFTYRGHTLDELQEMSVDEVAALLPARTRRSIERGLSADKEKLLEAAREADAEHTADEPIRTHLRDMPILPEMVGITFAVHTGQSFERVRVEPEMIGHYLGEFQLTRT
jgi:small subunit ribosomal protein S19